jgi:hypothetical protein
MESNFLPNLSFCKSAWHCTAKKRGIKEERLEDSMHQCGSEVAVFWHKQHRDPTRFEGTQKALLSKLTVDLQTEEKKVRKKLQSGRYMTLETRKDGTKFTNRQLKEAAERLQAISRSYDQRQHALVEQVCAASMLSLLLYFMSQRRSSGINLDLQRILGMQGGGARSR